MKYFFIVACPRSGTTFVSRAMDHATRTKSVIGNCILPVTCSIHALSCDKNDSYTAQAIEQGFTSEIIRKSATNSRLEAISRLLTQKHDIRSASEIVRGNWKHDKFVYKEPFISFSPRLAATEIASGIFWIIRDGRDVANSLVKTYNVLSDDVLRSCESNENPIKTERKVGDFFIPWWVKDQDVDQFLGSSQFVRAGLMWEYCVTKCKEQFRGDARVVETKYENIVTNKNLCINLISQFLSVTRNKSLVAACNDVSARSIGAHRIRDRREICTLEHAIGGTLETFGYTT